MNRRTAPHDLAALRAAAEAAGPRAAAALMALLQDYVDASEALDAVRAHAEPIMAAAERIDDQLQAAERTIARYRAVGGALVMRLRERQRRDPFRLDAPLHGLRRSEDLVIRTFHALDQDTVDAALGAPRPTVREVGHA